MSDVLFMTCRTKKSSNREILEKTHSKCRSDPTSLLCCGRSKHALATENVPSEQSTIRTPERVTFRMMFFVHERFYFQTKQNLRAGYTKLVRKLVHFAVKMRRLTSDMSIQGESFLRRWSCRSKDMQTWNWTTVLYTRN